jgi:hypothetical protein
VPAHDLHDRGRGGFPHLTPARLVSVDTSLETDVSPPTRSGTGAPGCRDQGVASPDLTGQQLDAGSDGRERELHAP